MTIRQARAVEFGCNLVLFACLAILLAVGCAEHRAAQAKFKKCTPLSVDATSGTQHFACDDTNGKRYLVEVTPR